MSLLNPDELNLLFCAYRYLSLLSIIFPTKITVLNFLFRILKLGVSSTKHSLAAGVAQWIKRLAVVWTFWELNPGRGDIFRTSPYRNTPPPNLCTVGTLQLNCDGTL